MDSAVRSELAGPRCTGVFFSLTMAFRLNRLHIGFPSGVRRFRWPQPSRRLQIWPAMSSHIHSLPRQHHLTLTPTKTIHFCVPLSNYSLGQHFHPIFSLPQCLRNYSEDSAPESQRSKASSSNGVSSTVSAQSQNAASDKALSSVERIKIILKEYGTVAFVFHISMSLCTLGVCYFLVSK